MAVGRRMLRCLLGTALFTAIATMVLSLVSMVTVAWYTGSNHNIGLTTDCQSIPTDQGPVSECDGFNPSNASNSKERAMSALMIMTVILSGLAIPLLVFALCTLRALKAIGWTVFTFMLLSFIFLASTLLIFPSNYDWDLVPGTEVGGSMIMAIIAAPLALLTAALAAHAARHRKDPKRMDHERGPPAAHAPGQGSAAPVAASAALGTAAVAVAMSNRGTDSTSAHNASNNSANTGNAAYGMTSAPAPAYNSMPPQQPSNAGYTTTQAGYVGQYNDGRTSNM